MARKANKISTRWIRETREAFRGFLDETNFPDPEKELWSIIVYGKVRRLSDFLLFHPKT